jgi:hypothetical protein
MEELSQRGYNFEFEADTEAEANEAEFRNRPLRYSFWGSRLWNIIAIVISVAGAAFFLQTHSAMMEPDPSLQMMVYAMVALIVSASFLVSGIRLLANHKDPGHPKLAVPTFEYWFIAILWFAISAYQIYAAGRSFIHYLELGFRVSMYVAIPSLVMSIFGFFLAMAFLYLALELRPQKGVYYG